MSFSRLVLRIFECENEDLSPVQTDVTLLANTASQHCCLDVTCCVRLLKVRKPVKLLATCKRTKQLPTMLEVVADNGASVSTGLY